MSLCTEVCRFLLEKGVQADEETGEATFGHYYLHQRALPSQPDRWLKFNDQQVRRHFCEMKKALISGIR